MSQSINVHMQVGLQPLLDRIKYFQEPLVIPISLSCPFCENEDVEVGTWG